MGRILGRGSAVRAMLVAFAMTAAVLALPATPAAAECAPVNRVLTNGDPNEFPGSLRLTVDGLGAFGSAVTGDPVLFRPVGYDGGAESTVFGSGLYALPVGEFLADDCEGQTVTVIEDSADRLRTATSFGDLQLELTQSVPQADEAGSTLVQTYRFENTGQTTVPLRVVRHLDTDLQFDSSAIDGAAVKEGGRALYGFDSTSTPEDPSTFVAISGAMGSTVTPVRWTVQPFRFTDDIVAAGAIPLAVENLVANDGDGNGIVDVGSEYDATLSQQFARPLKPGEIGTFTTRTRFGNVPPNQPPIAPNIPLPDQAPPKTSFGTVELDLLEHASDPDGDREDLTLIILSQPSFGDLTCDGGLCTYTVTDAMGFDEDTFQYAVEDAQGARSDLGSGIVEILIPDANSVVAYDDAATTAETTPVVVDVGSNDLSPLGATIIDFSQGNRGSSVVCEGFGCTYTPAPGVTGNETFTYTISGDVGGSPVTDYATVTVTVSACPDLRSAVNGQPGLVTGQEWIACSSPLANGTSSKVTPMMAEPHGAFGVLSTGRKSLVTSNASTGTSTSYGNGSTYALDIYDASILRLDLNVPSEHTCLSIDAVFASEEYPVYVNSRYNDAFVAQLDELSLSVVYNSAAGTNDVVAPGNFATDPNGKSLTVNSNLFATAFKNPAPGLGDRTKTEYNAATRLLRIRTPVSGGPESVFLSMFDVGDNSFDSAVFIDRMTTGTPENGCSTGAVVIDNTPPPTVTDLGGTGSLGRATMTWKNPTSGDFQALKVRRTQGSEAASSPTDGTKVYEATKPSTIQTTITNTGLEAGKNYTYTFFTLDGASPTPNRSAKSITFAGTELVNTAPGSDSTTVAYPDAAALRWRLRRAGNDAPLAGRSVVLRGKPQTATSFTTLDTDVTNDNGIAAFSVTPKRNWEYLARFAGGGALLGRASDTVLVRFQPRVTATVSDAALDLGESTTVQGLVSPDYEGKKVFLQELSEGTWTNIANRTLGPAKAGANSYSFSLRPENPGNLSFRVVLPAVEGVHVMGRSPVREIKVS